MHGLAPLGWKDRHASERSARKAEGADGLGVHSALRDFGSESNREPLRMNRKGLVSDLKQMVSDPSGPHGKVLWPRGSPASSNRKLLANEHLSGPKMFSTPGKAPPPR